MIFEEPIGIIELGNEKIDCLIFIINKNSETEILSTSTVRTEGIHNGIVINLIKATNVIRTCISLAEKKAEVTLKKINVILEQPDFLCTKYKNIRYLGDFKIRIKAHNFKYFSFKFSNMFYIYLFIISKNNFLKV